MRVVKYTQKESTTGRCRDSKTLASKKFAEIASMPLRTYIAVFLLLFSLMPQDTFAQDSPTDSAVVLRETQIQASMGLYPEILGTATPKQYFPLIQLITDEYGLIWGEVQLEGDKTGYLTDIIAIRMAPDELKSILAEVTEEEFAGWDQETIETIRGSQIRIGMTRTQLLLARGMPLASRSLGSVDELSYPREKILLSNGMVSAFTHVERLPLDKSVKIDLGTSDSAFTPGGGRWEDMQIGEQFFKIDVSGTGAGRFRIDVPTAGKYRLSGTWMVTEKSSTKVKYRILQRREEVAVFEANQRLHNLKTVELGEITLTPEGSVLIEISAIDGSPFSIGPLTLEYVNEPLQVAESNGSSN